jgi:YD repeat-containing protein
VSAVPNVTYTVTAASSLVTKVVDQGGFTRSASYTPIDDNTNPAESIWSSKMVTSYDPGDRISGIQADEDSSTSNVVSDVSYCYSKFVSGQSCPTATATTDTSLVQYATNNVTGTVSQFTYDKGNRLTEATSVNGSTTYTYGYDSDGNLTSGAAVGSLSYNSGNQITTSGYGYDGTGNLTADPANGTLSY